MEFQELSPTEVARSEKERCTVRGGILADGIGTGKTCVALALLDKWRCMEPCVPDSLSPSPIPSRATLVIVPPNIWDQWGREVAKFFQAGSLQVVMAEDVSFLKTCSLRTIAEADLVVVSYRIFASKSYCARRWRLETGECQGLEESMDTTRFPIFELFYFHRVIADEFHELIESFSDAMRSLCNIKAASRWGITSTPSLRTLMDVVTIAAFFQVKLAPTAEHASAFVMALIRRNTQEPVRVNLLQHKVLVTQTVHERALYLLRRREGASTHELLNYSSLHNSWSAGHEDHESHEYTRTAKEICKSKLQELYSPIFKLEEELKKVVVKIKAIREVDPGHAVVAPPTEDLIRSAGSERALASLQHFLEDERLERHMTRFGNVAKAPVQQAQRDLFKYHPPTEERAGLVRQVFDHVRSLGQHYTTALFFEQSLDECDGGIECPVCLKQCRRAECSIAKCAHKACSECWSKIQMTNPVCPICRQPIGGSLIALSVGHPRGVRELPELPGTPFGSKVACVVETLRAIKQEGPDDKILIFCECEELKLRVAAAFRELNLPHLKLAGNTAERCRTVREFLAPQGPAVLLLSMAMSPSGLDLSVANHVILVQPTWHGGSDDKSVDFEAQSVGRCWRLGQQRQVHVYRLCMVGTVEEDVVDRRMALWSVRHGALQQGASPRMNS